jgi:NADPH-dependent ferric siderophore reductase
LIGDETGLPAISRRLAELPAGARAIVVGEVDGPADELSFKTQADATVSWVHRNGAAPGESQALAKKLSTLKLPTGEFYAWVAHESQIAKALRAQLIAEHGANPKWMRAAGYWRRGVVAVHEVIES